MKSSFLPQSMSQTSVKDAVLWLFLAALPFQLGTFFFMDFSFINGVRVDYLAPALYATDLLFLVMIWLYREVLRNYIRVHSRAVTIIFVLLAADIVLRSGLLGLYIGLKYLQIVTLVVLFKHIKVNLSIFLSAFTTSAIIEVVLTMMQFASKSAIQGPFYYLGERFLTVSTPGIAKASLFGEQILRPYGTFSHPNSMGGFYTLLYAYVITITAQNREQRIMKFILLACLAILTLISFSKTAIFIFFMVTMIHLFSSSKIKDACIPCQIAKVFVGISIIAIFLSAQGDTFTLQKRLFLLESSFDILRSHFLFGTGLGQSLYALAEYPTRYSYVFSQPVHNIFMHITLEIGVLLAGALAFFSYDYLKKTWGKYKKHLLLPLIVIIISGMSDHYWVTLQQNMLLLGVIVGMSMNKTRKNHGKTIQKG